MVDSLLDSLPHGSGADKDNSNALLVARLVSERGRLSAEVAEMASR